LNLRLDLCDEQGCQIAHSDHAWPSIQTISHAIKLALGEPAFPPLFQAVVAKIPLAVAPLGCREEIFDALQGDLTASHCFVLDELMHHIEEIEARIARFDARLLGELESERNTLALLQTIPGVDLIGAAMLLIEIGTDMVAFGSADRLASWVGICPGNNESAEKRKSGRVRKGNLYVRRLLCEFAHAASRTTSVFKSKFQSLVVRRGYKRAIIAIGHKILRTIFFMLKRREHYRDSATDYEALSVQRNAPRWIKALTKFGFINPASA